MTALQNQAFQMIQTLSDDNVNFLIDFMERFMLPKNKGINVVQDEEVQDTSAYMENLEFLCKKINPYFTDDFDYKKIWEEHLDEKYGNIG